MTSFEQKERPLGKIELIAIALGGMIGGGILSILGVSVQIVGTSAPLAILLGGTLAFLAAYSYSKLATYYKDEGATYSFYKRTFPTQEYSIALIAWLIIFGYISTIALYAFTFSSYSLSFFPSEHPWLMKLVALAVIAFFAVVNLVSVKGMGKIEDILVYTKVAILLIISGLFLRNGHQPISATIFDSSFTISNLVIVAALTFVAYEGFQLVIHAYEEAKSPKTNVPSAIYWAIGLATAVYVLLSLGAIYTIPKQLLIRDKEFARAAGASEILGPLGYQVVVLGALLATASAISGTLFGASRLVAVIASDGVLPKMLAKRRKGHIPHYAIIAMSCFSYLFVLTGGLEDIIEFGSITFILVSLLMAFANFRIHKKTNSHPVVAILAMVFLGCAAILILYYEAITDLHQVLHILGIYLLLAVVAKVYSSQAKISISRNDL